MESSLVEESSSQGLRQNNTDSLSIATGMPNDNPTNNSKNIKEEEEESSHFKTKKRKMTSKVWDEFKKIKLPDGRQKAECHHCKSRLYVLASGSTTHLGRHLKDGRFDMMKMRQSMAHCILMHEHPFNIVEDEGFNMMQQCGMLQWECTSRAFIKNDCVKVYEIEKKKLKNYLKDWNIKNKVFTISVDNASNNNKAIKNLRETFSSFKKLPCGDTRCKMIVAKFTFPRMYSGDELKANIKVVEDALSELYEEYVSGYYSSGEQSGETSTSLTSINVTIQPSSSGWSKFNEFVKKNESVKPQKSELDNYLEEGVYICDDNSKGFDVLAWWRANSLRYRILSRMAQDILAIPITTVASEATFSMGSRVIDTYRASLAPEIVKVLLCGGD
nr:hypothetical protein [Tanacetum cinerariifolium]